MLGYALRANPTYTHDSFRIATSRLAMVKQKYIYWKEDNTWLGYLEDYPDYWTQGETEEDLKENLIDIYKELTSGVIQNVRKIAPELTVAQRHSTGNLLQ